MAPIKDIDRSLFIRPVDTGKDIVIYLGETNWSLNIHMAFFVAKNATINTAAANVAGGVNGMCLVAKGVCEMKGK